MMRLDEGNGLLESKRERLKGNIIDNCIDNSKPGAAFLLALALAAGNAADAVEIMCVGFIMSEMSDISTFKKEFLSSAVFMGMLLGGISCGYLSDIVGRRPCLLYSLGLNTLAGLASALAPNIDVLIFLRVVAGVGIGGSVPIVFSLGAEIFPSNCRGQYLSIIASFWMVGAIYVALSAWVMLGDDFNGQRMMPGMTWRPFAVVSALPAIVALLLTYYTIPESPRFLASKRQFQEAAIVLNHLSTVSITADDLQYECDEADANHIPHAADAAAADEDVNTTEEAAGIEGGKVDGAWRAHSTRLGPGGSGYAPIGSDPVGGTRSRSQVNSRDAQRHHRRSHSSSGDSSSIGSTRSKVAGALQRSTIGLLFQGKLRRTSLVLLVIWFTLSFGSYGMSTWISTLFEDVGIGNPYAAAFIFALANLPGNVVSLLLIEAYGRRWLLSVGMCLAAASALGFAFDTRIPAVVVVCASLFNAFSVMGWNSLDCLSVECFPTPVRTSAMGVLAAGGRLGAVSAQFVNGSLEKNIPLLLFVTSGCTVVGGLIAWMLPRDTAGSAMADFEDDQVVNILNASTTTPEKQESAKSTLENSPVIL